MFILKSWVKYYTKEIMKALKIISIGIIIVLTIILIKYRPAYEVTLAGEKIGYIENRDKIELKIKNYLEDTSGNIAFKEETKKPEYELKLINRDKDTEESEVLLAVEDSVIITYKNYAVAVDGDIKTTVETEEEAKNIVTNMKSDINESEINLNVGIVEQYTTDTNTTQSEEEANEILNSIKVAKITEYNEAQENKKKEEARKRATASTKVVGISTIAGISLSKPVDGSITSRYGSRSSIRSSVHTGVDVATSLGTPITPIASGTVTYASYKGSYGNLVIINHGNGIESYYAHCNQICVTPGQTVDAFTTISTVGSTGNSTGPHLHLEIRQNGNTLNPEDYVY